MRREATTDTFNALDTGKEDHRLPRQVLTIRRKTLGNHIFLSVHRDCSKVKQAIRRALREYKKCIQNAYYSKLKVENRCSQDNVFHCCVHKTASQWIRAIMSDPIVVRSSGLLTYQYHRKMPGNADPRPLNARLFDTPFPKRKIISPLFINYPCFKAIPKPENYKVFFIMRDPRDLVVSWYFSMRDTHPLLLSLGETRKQLNEVSVDEGLRFVIDRFSQRGHFNALETWKEESIEDPNVMLVKYEDLVSSHQAAHFRKLFDHCDIKLSSSEISIILDKYSFGRMKSQSARGDSKSHYRKGSSGDWVNHFTDPVRKKFGSVAGGLPELLGYQ